MPACVMGSCSPAINLLVDRDFPIKHPLQRQQGIVSILASDPDLKMPEIEKIHPPEEAAEEAVVKGEEEEEQRLGAAEIWNAIQEKQRKEREEADGVTEQKGGQFDLWRCILGQAAEDGGKSAGAATLPPPYVHPLVKRSGSSLSEKSLEICTESLGSETGWDALSSGDTEDDDPPPQVMAVEEVKEQNTAVREEAARVNKYNYLPSAKRVGPPRSFPPPLPSLAHKDGANLHMRCHRHDGRLVMEAVTVPLQNRLCALRHDGRLLLTLSDGPNGGEDHGDNEEEIDQDLDGFREEMDPDGDDDDIWRNENQNQEAEEEEEIEILMDNRTPVFNIHGSIMTKLINPPTKTTQWRRQFNTVVATVSNDDDEDSSRMLSKSLPPQPRMAQLIPTSATTTTTTIAATTAATFNAYEYYWRRSTAVGATAIATAKEKRERGEEQVVVVQRGDQKGEYLVPLLRGCKEPRRSLLFLEPHCIATS